MTPPRIGCGAMWWTCFLLVAVAALLALAITPVVRLIAHRVGAFDEPGVRRVHAARIPRLGGLAVLAATFAAFGGGTFAAGELAGEPGQGAALITGTVLMMAVGIVDDLRGLGPLPKLAVEIVAALIALAGGFGFNAVTNPFTDGALHLGAFGQIITLLWIVGITNAINLIDGLDGLAVGVALIVSITLVVVALDQGHPEAATLAAALAGALAGFLVYNFHPASIFLGDSGALAVGYVLSLLAIQAQGKGNTAVVVLAPVLSLGFPILETGLSFGRRLLDHGARGVFRADDDHIHHRLVRVGLPHRRAVLLLYGVCAFLSVLAYMAILINGPGNVLLIAAVVLAAYGAVRKLGYGRSAT